MTKEWTLKEGEDVFWTFDEKGIVVKVKTVPKDPNEKVTVIAPNGRDVLVARVNLKEPPSEDELLAMSAKAADA